MDQLVAKSNDLSMQSKMFYTQVRLSWEWYHVLCVDANMSIYRQRNRIPAASLCE